MIVDPRRQQPLWTSFFDGGNLAVRQNVMVVALRYRRFGIRVASFARVPRPRPGARATSRCSISIARSSGCATTRRRSAATRRRSPSSASRRAAPASTLHAGTAGARSLPPRDRAEPRPAGTAISGQGRARGRDGPIPARRRASTEILLRLLGSPTARPRPHRREGISPRRDERRGRREATCARKSTMDLLRRARSTRPA